MINMSHQYNNFGLKIIIKGLTSSSLVTLRPTNLYCATRIKDKIEVFDSNDGGSCCDSPAVNKRAEDVAEKPLLSDSEEDVEPDEPPAEPPQDIVITDVEEEAVTEHPEVHGLDVHTYSHQQTSEELTQVSSVTEDAKDEDEIVNDKPEVHVADVHQHKHQETPKEIAQVSNTPEDITPKTPQLPDETKVATVPKIVTPSCSKMMEESSLPTDESDSMDDDRPMERWAPLGAPLPTPPPSMHGECCHNSEQEQLRLLEEEQEQLNSSLLALTTHFAQVQFRLKQIVSANPDDKEILLKELEEFAFKGIPDVRGCKNQDAQIIEEMTEHERESKISEQRDKQQQLIQQLKSQLEDLEVYAYETGDGELPTSTVMDKQKVIIEQLRQKLDLDLGDFNSLGTEDLRQRVDKAIGQIVNPVKVKEKLVEQLKTQVVDLERFIDFLQGECTSPGPLGKERCTCAVHHMDQDCSDNHSVEKSTPGRDPRGKNTEKKMRDTTLSILKQALTVLQLFAISQFGCGGREFERNLLKRTTKGNHWGDLRAKLEVAVERVLEQAKIQEKSDVEDTDYTSDSDDAPAVQCNKALTMAVRKELAMALKDLMEHGLMEVGQSTSLVPMGCFPNRSKEKEQAKMMHAWDLLVKYYQMKHGREYNESPARKLSQAFSLDIVGGKPITAKQTLLSAVDTIISSHKPLKRSEDSQFKAFVCLALNEKKLVTWLKLLLRTHTLIEFYYQPWSYVMKTGFDDSLEALDKLSTVNFHLPVDLAVRPFKNIKDAF